MSRSGFLQPLCVGIVFGRLCGACCLLDPYQMTVILLGKANNRVFAVWLLLFSQGLTRTSDCLTLQLSVGSITSPHGIESPFLM